MRRNHFLTVFILLIIVFIAVTTQSISQQVRHSKYHWYKGNTHAHTTNSDGDSPPEVVVKWYRDHGYNFLFITDHNHLTEVGSLNEAFGEEGKFMVFQGDEVSDKFGEKSIHLNALNPKENILPQGGDNVVAMLQNNVDAVRKASGIPHINHPNFRWSITANELKQIQRCVLFEIYNGHPSVNNLAGGGAPSVEEMWDNILSSGKIMYGMAVDDVHKFKDPWDRKAPRPGQAWVMVRAKQLSATDIVNALEQGDFYASTGVELDAYEADATGINIDIRVDGSTKYRTLFIGKSGKIFKEAITNSATYSFQGGEMYVRAKIVDSNGNMAWTQPIFLNKE